MQLIDIQELMMGTRVEGEAVFIEHFPVESEEPDDQLILLELINDDVEYLDDQSIKDLLSLADYRIENMDLVSAYIEKICSLEPFEHQEQIEIFKRYKVSGDEEIADQIIRRNGRLVLGIVKRYLYSGLTLDELLSEGMLGLTKSIQKFDPDRNYAFSSYATWWIKYHIKNSIAKEIPVIPLSQEKLGILKQLKIDAALLGNGSLPSLREIVESNRPYYQGLKGVNLELLYSLAFQKPLLLDAPMGLHDPDTSNFGEMLASNDLSVEMQVEINYLLRLIFDPGSKLLDQNEKLVLCLRYAGNLDHTWVSKLKENLENDESGISILNRISDIYTSLVADEKNGCNIELNNKDKRRMKLVKNDGVLTNEEIGRILGLSQERIRQIHKSAVSKLSSKREYLGYPEVARSRHSRSGVAEQPRDED